MENWTMILSTEDTVQLSLAIALLHDNNIPLNTIKKRDSAYVMIGYDELYVPNQFAEEAIKLMETLD